MPEDTIRATIVFDTGKLRSAANKLQAPGGGAPGAAGRAGGGLFGAAKGIGKIAAGVTAGLAVWDGIKRLTEKLVSSSPHLQASLDIMRKSFEFMLRPIGDAIGNALRPFALLWMRYALKWYKEIAPKMQEWFGKLVDNTSGFVERITGATEEGILGGAAGENIKTLFADLIPAELVATWEQFKQTLIALWDVLSVDLMPLWRVVGNILGVVIVAALELVRFNLEMLQRGLEVIGPVLNYLATGLETALAPILEALPGIITGVVDSLRWFSDLLFTLFKDGFPAAWEMLKTKVSAIWEKFAAAIESAWEAFATKADTFWQNLIGTIGGAWETIKEKISAVIEAIKEKLASIPLVGGMFGGGGDATGTMGDFLVRGNQVIPFSPQDTIMGFKEGQGIPSPMAAAGTSTININISALDAASIDDRVISRIIDGINSAQRRGLTGRTLQGIGV